MDIKQFFNIFKRWIWLMALGLIVGAGLGYYFSSRETPIYQAETRFIVLTAAPTNEFQVYYNYLDTAQLISTYTELLSADSTFDKASEVLGYSVSAGQAKAERVGETQFIRLVVKDTDPVRAAAIANSLVAILVEQNEELQSVRYVTTEKNLQDRVERTEAQIEAIQKQITDISNASVEESLNEVTAQIETLQNQINDLERKIENIDPLIATDEERIALADYQDQLDQLTPVLELYQEIYTNLVVLGQGVQGSVSESTQLNQLKFTLDLYQQIYISSMASLESLRLSQAQSTPNVVQTEPAKVPETPISPKPLQTAALAGVIGVLLTGGVAFMIEYLDDTIKTPEEIKELTGLPVIGLISDFESRSSSKILVNGKASLFIVSQPRSAISEAIRSLRTNLEFSAVDHPLSSIVITSANPSEGKSTIAANLAFALAQSGKKTLLLDADMRRPNLHSFFGISNRIGLSDLIRSNLDLHQVTRTFESNSKINIMTSGSIPPNPSELLASEKMSKLLKYLKTRYDIVVIDSSPMVVADPQILSSMVDGVIFIAQPGKTRVNLIKTNLGQLDQINARILGVVFNRIPRHGNSYYGGYYYSQYYSKGQPEYYEETVE